jgi:hypothetical protein
MLQYKIFVFSVVSLHLLPLPCGCLSVLSSRMLKCSITVACLVVASYALRSHHGRECHSFLVSRLHLLRKFAVLCAREGRSSSDVNLPLQLSLHRVVPVASAARLVVPIAYWRSQVSGGFSAVFQTPHLGCRVALDLYLFAYSAGVISLQLCTPKVVDV